MIPALLLPLAAFVVLLLLRLLLVRPRGGVREGFSAVGPERALVLRAPSPKPAEPPLRVDVRTRAAPVALERYAASNPASLFVHRARSGTPAACFADHAVNAHLGGTRTLVVGAVDRHALVCVSLDPALGSLRDVHAVVAHPGDRAAVRAVLAPAIQVRACPDPEACLRAGRVVALLAGERDELLEDLHARYQLTAVADAHEREFWSEGFAAQEYATSGLYRIGAGIPQRPAIPVVAPQLDVLLFAPAGASHPQLARLAGRRGMGVLNLYSRSLPLHSAVRPALDAFNARHRARARKARVPVLQQ